MMEYEKAEAVVVLFDQCEALCAGSCQVLANWVIDCDQSHVYEGCDLESWWKGGFCSRKLSKL